MKNIQTPRGTRDLYGSEVSRWQAAEAIFFETAKRFGYTEIRTPAFEHTELFLRGVGETTDVVQKEMYSFEDRSGRSLTLKPEGTAGAARAFIEHNMYSEALPVKLYYNSPLFRYEKPQAGREREYWSFGVELFGSMSPAADAEIICIGHEIIRSCGVKNVTLHINSLGGAECRAAYNAQLKDYVRDSLPLLCSTCRVRFEKNPLRILDCKNPACREVMNNSPTVLQTMGPKCREHFDDVLKYLDALGISYIVDERLVRGLDYYTRTVFEFICPDVGAQSTLLAGGRYDNLITELGGPATGAVGFGLGTGRVILALDKQNGEGAVKSPVDIFIGSIGNGSYEAQKLAYGLRRAGFKAETDVVGRNVKAQLKYADKIGARYCAVIGEDEINTGVVKIKDMLGEGNNQIETREVREVKLDRVGEFLASAKQ